MSRLMPVVVLALLLVPGAAAPQDAPAAPAAAPQDAPPTPTTPAEPAAPAPGGRQGRAPRGPRPAPPATGQVPADLEATMDGMKGQMKALGAALGTANREAALVAVSDLQRLVLHAKSFEPSNMNEIAEAERPAHLTAYRKALLGALKELVEVELNVLDGKHEAALEQLKGPLSELRDDAHDRFQPRRELR